VTDHAVVRYLERIEGMDLESVRAHIRALAQQSTRRNGEFIDHPSGLVLAKREKGAVATLYHPASEEEKIIPKKVNFSVDTGFYPYK